MDYDATWAEEEFGEADLGDVRRNARLVQLASVLGAQPSASLPDATDDRALLKAAYRFFDNDYVRAEAMLKSHVQSTTQRMQAVPLVLAVQDTTYLDWTDHPATEDLGPLAASSHQGLLAHTTLALTPERAPLGLLQQQVWAREQETGGTGMESGIAIPHAKSPAVLRASVAFGHSQAGVDFGAEDGSPADLIFLIAAPEGADDLHVRVLSRLARRLIHEGFRTALREAASPEAVYDVIRKEVQL